MSVKASCFFLLLRLVMPFSKYRNHFYLFVLAPMLLALLIYVSFRSEKILINLLIDKSFLGDIFNHYRKMIAPIYTLIPHSLCFSFPSALWLFSILNFFLLVWNFEINRSNFYWYLLPLVYCLVLEFLQKKKVTDGTFDKIDVLFYLLSSVAFFALHKRKVINLDARQTSYKLHWQSALSLSIFVGIVIFSDCF